MVVVVLLLDVSIVAGSSSLTDGAYQPNPVQISIRRYTVTWTNDDSQLHTVTSGVNGQPDGRFDSSIMAPAATAVIFLKSITFEVLSRIGIIW
jgi:plastocyanin